MSEDAHDNVELPAPYPSPAGLPPLLEIAPSSGNSSQLVGMPECPICKDTGTMYDGHACMCTIVRISRE